MSQEAIFLSGIAFLVVTFSVMTACIYIHSERYLRKPCDCE